MDDHPFCRGMGVKFHRFIVEHSYTQPTPTEHFLRILHFTLLLQRVINLGHWNFYNV